MFPGHPRYEESTRPGEGEEYELRGDVERLYDLDADAKIIGWRTESFEALNFEPVRAAALAVRRDIDREVVERMIKAGATPEQVSLILL